MTKRLNRRNFLKSSGLAFGALGLTSGFVSAVEPFKRTGAPRLLLSLAAYSFRDYFIQSSHSRALESDPARQLDMLQFVEYCAEHGCDGAEVTSYYFPKEVNAAYLIKLRRHAFLRGLAISGTAVGNNFVLPPGPKRDAEIAATKRWIDYASVMGAPHVRIFAGSTHGESKEEAKKMCIGAIEECGAYAGERGIFLGLENHGGIGAEPQELLGIIWGGRRPRGGGDLDTRKFQTDEPHHALTTLAAEP